MTRFLIAALGVALTMAAVLVFQVNSYERTLQDVRIAVADEMARDGGEAGAALIAFAHGYNGEKVLSDEEKVMLGRYLQALGPRIDAVPTPWPLSMVIERAQSADYLAQVDHKTP